MNSKKQHPVIYLIIAIFILIVPTIIYLIILVPKLTDEYNTLMASGGIIGGAGVYGANKIPDSLKFSKLYKLSANSFSMMIVVLLVEKFIVQLIGLAATIVLSYVIYKILLEVYRNARTRKQNTELAETIAANIVASSK